jgi:hypothetical protein
VIRNIRCDCLPQGVTTVDEAVVASHVARTRRSEVDSKVVEVVNSTKALLRSVVHPDALLGVKSRNTVKGGVHVARRDGVDADVVASPLSSEGLGELNDSGLGGVVAGLLLRVVDDGARHGSDVDHGAASVELDHLLADSLSDEESAGDVDIEKATELLRVVGLGLNVGAGSCQYVCR